MGPAISFTYPIGAVVAIKRGVTDDKRTGSDVDGTAKLKREVNSSNWHRRTWSIEPVQRGFSEKIEQHPLT